MGRKKMSDAARIRAYYEKNPGAKPMDVAKALNVKPTNVYIARSKMKQEQKTVVQPTDKANAWLAANPWFGKDAKATAIAVDIHNDLLKQGVVADSDEYYKLLDERMRVAAKAALAEKLGVQVTAKQIEAEERAQHEEQWHRVNHPPHYKTGGIETIDFIEAKNLNYRLGNVVKYITRAEHKGNRKEDLQKALWYLQREIDLS